MTRRTMFRTILFPITLLAAIGLCAQQPAARTGGPYLEIDKMIHEYGTLKKGANGDAYFTITNTGDAPLTIARCESNCGCTVPECPKEPVAPGASARVKVHYDTQRTGRIHRTITMATNAVNARQLQVIVQGHVAE